MSDVKVDYTEEEATKAVEYIRKAKHRAFKARTYIKLTIAKAKLNKCDATEKEVLDYMKSHTS